LGDNPGSIGPILKQGRNAEPGENPGLTGPVMQEQPDQ
jgi:hypothetical protein